MCSKNRNTPKVAAPQQPLHAAQTAWQSWADQSSHCAPKNPLNSTSMHQGSASCWWAWNSGPCQKESPAKMAHLMLVKMWCSSQEQTWINVETGGGPFSRGCQHKLMCVYSSCHSHWANIVMKSVETSDNTPKIPVAHFRTWSKPKLTVGLETIACLKICWV